MRASPLVSLLLLGACDAGPDDTAPAGPDLPDPVCDESAAPWAAGTPVYADASEAWGLPAMGVVAVRFHVADIDADGWPDVLIRGSSCSDDFSGKGVRCNWLLRNTGLGTFEDVTQESGAFAVRGGTDPNVGRYAENAAWADVDNDGDVDLLTARSDPGDAGGDTTEILLNDGTGRFTFGPEENELRSLGTGGPPAGLSFVDFDRDGNVDLWSPQFGNPDTAALQDRLLRGDGTGAFTDITSDAGLSTQAWTRAWDYNWDALNNGECHSWGWGGTACDLNNDGWTELMASSYGRFPNALWQGGAEGAFTNRSVPSGYAYDGNEDWTDNESARCYCHLHPDAMDCDGVPAPEYFECDDDSDVFRWDHSTGREPFQLGGNSGTTTCADVDNDGWMDLVTGEIAHWDVGQSSDRAELLVNAREADVRFDRPGLEATGLTRWHASTSWDEGHTHSLVHDIDLDGWPDIYFGSLGYPDEGNRGRWYHQISPALFEQISTDDFFDYANAEGAGAADFDRDGDLDILVGHSANTVRLYENLLGEGRNFLQIDLAGTGGSNVMAIGARVQVTAGGVTQTQEVEGGHGHFGNQGDHTLTFGLGAACQADVTITWPDAAFTEESWTLPAGWRFRLVQGALPEVVE